MKRRTIIILAVVLIIVLVLSRTVLNRWWWAQRINRKFQLQQALTRDGAFVRSQSLRSLITLYYYGTFVDGNLAVAPPNE